MRGIWILVCLFASAAPVSATPQVPDASYVEIDGSKNPEQIPAWAAWETAFTALALAERRGSEAVPKSLQMSDGDRRLVFAAAKGQAARDAACQQRVERLKSLVGNTEIAVINERTREIQLQCRQASLDAAESLMNALSPDGQVSMTAWLQNVKAGIRALVPKTELEHYRRPY